MEVYGWISLQYTKTIAISKESTRCKLESEGTGTEELIETKYQGFTLFSYGDMVRNTFFSTRDQVQNSSFASVV